MEIPVYTTPADVTAESARAGAEAASPIRGETSWLLY